MNLQKIMKYCSWKDATTFAMSLAVAIQLIVSISPDTAKASAFDDFNNGNIDGSKWAEPVSIRVVEGGKLSMAVSGHADQNDEGEVETFLKNSSSVTKLQAKVTIESYQLDPDISDVWGQMAGVNLYGTHYKSDVANGYLEAGVVIIDINDGEGLKAWCWAEATTGNTGQDSEFAESMDIVTGKPYTIGIEYKQGTNEIICSIQDGANPVQNKTLDVSAAPYSGPSDDEKGLAVWYERDSALEADYSIAAVFDDIETEAGVYDDFTSNTLSPTKWSSMESERRITNNSLELSQHNDGSPNESIYLGTAGGVSGTDYYQASIIIDSESAISGGATGAQAGIGGFFYNDLADGGADYLTGDHICQVVFVMAPSGELAAESRVLRCSNADCSNIVGAVFSQEFTTTPSLDTEHIVSIKKSGNSILFTMDGEQLTHNISGNMFTPFSSFRGMEAGVWSDAGQSGNITAFFDNIFFKEKAFPWVMLLPAITAKR